MDRNAQLYYQSAVDLKFQALPLRDISGFFIKLHKKILFFRGGETPFNCGSSIEVASNKYCMNKLLDQAGFPVPRSKTIARDKFEKGDLKALINDLQFPLVIKPTHGTANGQDVLCNIANIEELKTQLEKKFQKYPFLTIEAFHPHLNQYRVLVFYNRVIGVVQRFPASIVGDGIHSIRALIDLKNADREKIKAIYALGPILVDEECHSRLKELKMSLDTIPKEKETVVLCYTSNDSRGGTIESLGKKINKENAQLLCRAARTLGLNFVGFDVLCEDILIPIEKSHGVILEANHNPDIALHEDPMFGPPKRVSKIMMRRLLWTHPFAYLKGLYQSGRRAFYFRVSLFILMLMIGKLFLVNL